MASKPSEMDLVLQSTDRETLLQIVSQRIYESLAIVHEGLARSIDDETADEIMINAVSANLGHIIGQLDAKSQKKYGTLARQSIKEHTLIGTMQKDIHLYGDIGHA